MEVWDYLTELLRDNAGSATTGPEYLWLHESTKRVMLGLNIDGRLPPYHFAPRWPDDGLTTRVLNELYAEAGIINDMSQHPDRHPDADRERRLPFGSIASFAGSINHSFNLSTQ